MRRLGKRWKKLHRLVYLIGVLGIVHFFWLVKNVYTEPIIYGAILAILLLTRARTIKHRVLRWRQRIIKRRPAVQS
jgi:sulfoxide reductase heme-binding subunit YedZ